MATVDNQELKSYCQQMARGAKTASASLSLASCADKNVWLKTAADEIRSAQSMILEANERDIAAAPGFGLSDAQVDRLRLTPERVESIASGLDEVAALPDPIGDLIEFTRRPNGLEISKVRVPLGVVFFIYESRPNVTVDAAAICLKSGNAVILRGGKEAAHSSLALVDCLHRAAADTSIPAEAIQFVNTSDRDAVGHFLGLNDLIDVAIPRGGEGLIRRVSRDATMPVIKHFAGNCHVYVDQRVDQALAVDVVVNSKCHRLGVCNACESLLVHSAVAEAMLPRLSEALLDRGVELRGCKRTCDLVSAASLASEDDFAAEYLAAIISIKVVDDLDAAIEHINRYGSHHTDAIVTTDLAASRKFTAAVDSSAVMVNASTRFNDGGEFGLGAEIGISTDRFHARGPCGLKELTSYKYIVQGEGHVRQ